MCYSSAMGNPVCPKYRIQPEIKSTQENLKSHSSDQGKSRLFTEFDEIFIAESSFDGKSAGTVTVLNLQPATF